MAKSSSSKKKKHSSSSTNTAAAMYDDRSMMAHEAETIIPGSFVVLQGNPGDGMCDTISTCPELPYHEEERRSETDEMQQRQQQEEAVQAVTSAVASSAPSPSNDEADEFQDVEIPPEAPLLGQLANQKRPAATMGMMGSNVMSSANAAGSSSSTRSHTRIRHGTAVSSQQQQQRQKTSMGGTEAAAGGSGGGGSNNDDFIVVTDDSASEPTQHATAASRNNQQRPSLDETAIEEWKQSCRDQEIRHRKEFRESLHQTANAMFDNTLQKLFEEQDMWWQSEGKLCIFRDIPTKLHNGTVLRSIMGSLNPGTTVVATSIVYLDSKTLERKPTQPLLRTSGGMAPHNIYPKGRVGWIQMVRIDIEGNSNVTSSRSRSGYVCLSLDGYPLMAPGLPSLYTDPHVWIWRVSCPAGAYVREGLSLQTNHIDTLPYGSLIRVTRRTINGQGLSRLLIHAIVTEESDYDTATTATAQQQRSNNQQQQPRQRRKRWIDGWISELLNPQSGQRGVVAQPLPFPVPALYRVTLSMGAVIRSDIELSSPQIGMAPQGSVLAVVGRAFSESPSEKCLERLQLAGNGGWISVRLNRPPPHDDLVVEFVGIDSQFHPDRPGLYHLQAQRTVQASTSGRDDDDEDGDVNGHPKNSAPSSSGAEDLSSIDDNSGPSSDSNSDMSPSGNNNGPAVRATYHRRPKKPSNNASSSSNTKSGATDAGKKSGENAKCLICLTEERNATIVHGETGHVACCLVCARILKARGDKCPVCRLDIDLVIQHFWA